MTQCCAILFAGLSLMSLGFSLPAGKLLNDFEWPKFAWQEIRWFIPAMASGTAFACFIWLLAFKQIGVGKYSVAVHECPAHHKNVINVACK